MFCSCWQDTSVNSNNEVPITSITLRGAGHQVNIVLKIDILGVESGRLVWGGVVGVRLLLLKVVSVDSNNEVPITSFTLRGAGHQVNTWFVRKVRRQHSYFQQEKQCSQYEHIWVCKNIS